MVLTGRPDERLCDGVQPWKSSYENRDLVFDGRRLPGRDCELISGQEGPIYVRESKWRPGIGTHQSSQKVTGVIHASKVPSFPRLNFLAVTYLLSQAGLHYSH